MGQLPELSGPAEIYYDTKESKSYNNNSRILKIQTELTKRALDLLNIQVKNPLFLDIGCGSGLSGKILTQSNFNWIGIDISNDMLQVNMETFEGLGLIEHDIGKGLFFKEESFDYCISISAIQWLFQSYKKEDVPIFRIKSFFKDLYEVTSIGAVLQFYCSKKETEILKNEASKSGFYGGIVIDSEGTKNEKMFLVLSKSRPSKDVKKFSRKEKKARYTKN